MRILQLIPYFTWSHGGAVRVVYDLSRNLSMRGHDVTLYTTDAGRDHRLRENERIKFDNNVKIRYFRCINNWIEDRIRVRVTPQMCLTIKTELKNFDIIHLHDFRSYQSIIIHHYAKKYGVPYVLQPHASTPRILREQKLKWLFDVAFGYRILKDATKIIAVSKEEAEYIRRMGVDDKKISVIYNGLDIESFKNLPEYGRFRKKYGINGTMILYLGRISKLKGIDFAIKAFSKLTKEINDIILVIAGSDDEYKAELEKLIEKLNLNDKIKFTGSINDDDKMSAYIDADLFVHPVLYMGGVGLTPLEAILCDTPIIITKGCGETIKEANCGYFVKDGAVEELKEKMKKIIKNPEEGKEMVERGKKYIKANLAWDKVVRKVEELYEDCL